MLPSLRNFVWVTSGLLFMLASGCINIYQEIPVPPKYVVMFDSDGHLVDPTGNLPFNPLNHHTDLWPYPRIPDEDYQAYLDHLFQALRSHPPKDGKRKLLFFIHGGLNTQVDSLARITEPLDDGKPRFQHIVDEGYFPIFINWKSSLWSSYFDQLLFVRQGERRNFWGPLTSPVVLATDIGHSLLRAPLVWGSLVWNDLQTVPALMRGFPPSYADEVAVELLCRYQYKGEKDCANALKFKQPPYCVPVAVDGEAGQRPRAVTGSEENTYPIAVGEDERQCGEMDAHFAAYVVTFPFKLITAPVLDAFGTSAWDNMERRIQLLFSSEEELKRSKLTEARKQGGDLAHLPASGGLSLFLQQLVEQVRRDQPGDAPWEIAIVGHSMGTIIVNEIVRNFGGELPIHDVVYLAGATTIRDYEDTMYPYLRRRLPDTRLYQFTLHPEAESGEIYSEALDLAPRGSLLVWIDNFLADPLTLNDRTVGRYNNFMAAAHLAPDDIRPQIAIRTFSAGRAVSKYAPQTHSDVAARFRFWKSECWQPTAPLDASCFLPLK